MDIIKLVKENEKRLLDYRRHFHKYPELTGQEQETIKFIRQELDKYHVEYVEIENGGILVTIDSDKPGKTLLLRADIDALPIEECQFNEGGIKKPCVSLNKGVAHMCGHDCHAAMLLVALQLLNENKDKFTGKIYGLFERGEESGGNIYYCLKYFKENNIEYDNCFGIHVGSILDYKLGNIIICPGQFYAGMIIFDITIHGKGGHGSRPDLCNNPIDVFVDVVAALREIEIDKNELFSYSVCVADCGSKCNVIADILRFEGSIRFFKEELADYFITEFKSILKEKSEKYGCTFTDVFKINTYPVINDELCCDIGSNAFSKLGFDIDKGQAKMGSESFAYLQMKSDGLFINLITSNQEKGITAQTHNYKFDVDEDVLYKGVCCHIGYALEYLNGDYQTNRKNLNLKELFTKIGVNI